MSKEAISYDHLVNDLQGKGKNDRALGILIGNPNCEFVKNNIINKIAEYHHRSNYGIDFYFPGYGTLWGGLYGLYPDVENVCKIKGEVWAFSTQSFCEFIDKLEDCSIWKYSGETELIILNFKNGELDFSEVLVFWLDRMVKEDVISSPSNFFQDIFRMFKHNASIERIRDKLSFNQLGTTIINSIKNSIPYKLGKIYDDAKYFCTRNLSK
ncbi:hypothetical protein ACSU64_27010 [Bacillaceae bacterium C204]|uniref:hypothetical protein n=1 Tax=Neobacillus sp. 204 TaxID=3383351 RepID=UPI00397B1B68